MADRCEYCGCRMPNYGCDNEDCLSNAPERIEKLTTELESAKHQIDLLKKAERRGEMTTQEIAFMMVEGVCPYGDPGCGRPDGKSPTGYICAKCVEIAVEHGAKETARRILEIAAGKEGEAK